MISSRKQQPFEFTVVAHCANHLYLRWSLLKQLYLQGGVGIRIKSRNQKAGERAGGSNAGVGSSFFFRSFSFSSYEGVICVYKGKKCPSNEVKSNCIKKEAIWKFEIILRGRESLLEWNLRTWFLAKFRLKAAFKTADRSNYTNTLVAYQIVFHN